MAVATNQSARRIGQVAVGQFRDFPGQVAQLLVGGCLRNSNRRDTRASGLARGRRGPRSRSRQVNRENCQVRLLIALARAARAIRSSAGVTLGLLCRLVSVK